MNNSQNSSFGNLHDSNSGISSDERSIELDLLMEPEEPISSTYDGNRDHTNNRLPMYSDDIAPDEMSLGASKKQSSTRSAYSVNTRQFSSIQSFVHFTKGACRYRPKEILYYMKKPQVMTLLLLLAITCFVASSYHQVMAATERIEDIRDGESKLIVHMHKVCFYFPECGFLNSRVETRTNTLLSSTDIPLDRAASIGICGKSEAARRST